MTEEERQEVPVTALAEPEFGGYWIPEVYRPALDAIGDGLRRVVRKRSFRRMLQDELRSFGGRPTPLYTAASLSERFGGAKILLKREDRLETGSRHLTVALGQALLARAQGRRRLVAASATGAGAVAVAASAVRAGLAATIFAGTEDLRVRERAFSRAETLGADLVPVDLGRGGISGALQVAFAEWLEDAANTNLVLTAPIGPEPFPELVAELEGIVGREISAQIRKRRGKNAPDLVVAPLLSGGTVGVFSPWVEAGGVRLIGTAAAPLDPDNPAWRRPKIVHGARSVLLPPPAWGSEEIERPNAYRALAPQVATWVVRGVIGTAWISERAARAASRLLAETEGILVSVRSGAVLAEVCERASHLTPQELVVGLVSGRGDDDVGELVARLPAPEPIGPARNIRPVDPEEPS